MRKGIIVNLKRFRLLEFINLNKFILILCSLFVTGIILGSAVFFKNEFLSDLVKILFDKAILIHTQNKFFKKLFSCFLRYFIVLILYFISGTSMLGIAVIPFLTLWQGVFTGNLIAQFYNLYGLNGIAFNAIIVIPPLSVFIVCCFFAAKHSIDFSLCMAKLTMPKSRPISLYLTFKNFCGKYLIFLGVSFICTLIEIILNLLFLKFFNF